ncbi:MAG: type II toxin-antitoxin system VapC family toxin [Xanthomonadales bacterium]|nr:type II toxin-antitoxin system VapC family toxin [Xanthomonadales bacterium]
MLGYLLDTNIISELTRNPRGSVYKRIARVGESSVATSIVVATELRYGVQKSGSSRLAEHVDQLLSAIAILPLEPPADRHYGEIRHHLYRAGTPIGPNDLLIAAQARAEDLTVVTTNQREFARVPGLKVENWLSGG